MKTVPMTLEEARILAAPLYKKMFDEIKEQNLSEGQPALKTKADWELDRFARCCYSLPWLRKEIAAWMIDFCWGTENPFNSGKCEESGYTNEEAEKFVDLLNNGGKDEFAEITGGPMMKQVIKFLKDHNIRYTDTGSGGCGGHIGVPCTDSEKDFLMEKAYGVFGKAVERGLILVKVAWFKPRLFFNDDEAENWLSARGLI